MYFPPADYVSPSEAGLDRFDEVAISWGDKQSLKAWWAAPNGQDRVIMFFHGNGSAVSHGIPIYQTLSDLGYGVWGVEYPGYPGATDQPSETAIIQAALAQYDYLIEQGTEPQDITVYGTSLGAAVAAQVASRRAVGGLVLEAPFYSMTRMARLNMPIFAFPFLIKDKYESAVALEDVRVPLLWIHGTSDQVIPLTEGQRLFDAYSGPKSERVIPGGTHVNLWAKGGKAEIIAFMAH